jgi:thioredoxin 1
MPDAPEYIDGKPLKYHGCKTRATTEEAATEYPENCLIIWTADWCSRCPRMKELGERLKAEGYDVFYIDYDKNKAKAREDGVKAVPTAIVHRGGEEVHRVVGITANNQRSVEAEIRKILRKNDGTDEYEIY